MGRDEEHDESDGERLWLGARRFDVLRWYADGPFREDADGMGAPYLELAALELSGRGRERSLVDGNLRTGAEMLYEENEPGDWVLPGLLRVLYRFADRIPDPLVGDMDDALAAFPYEFDASRLTENQQMLQYTGAYLAGHRLADRTFEFGESGAALRDRAVRLGEPPACRRRGDLDRGVSTIRNAVL